METHFLNVLLKMVIRMPSVICKRRLIVFALLLTLNEDAKEEPVLDSYKDLLGYCILTLIEIK